METIVLVDSCCDLPQHYIKEEAYLELIGMPVKIDDLDFIDDLGEFISHNLLYEKLRAGTIARTAEITVSRFVKAFEKHIEMGRTIIYIGLSQRLSNTYHNALQGKKEVLAVFPDAEIHILNGCSASVGQGLLALKAVDLLKSGCSAEETFTWITSHERHMNHWFAVQDLEYLKQGGKISHLQATVGGMLNIKPIFTVDAKGIIKVHSKVKGQRKSIDYLVEQIKAFYDADLFDKIIIGHGNAPIDAEALLIAVSKVVHIENIIVTELSATIASHVGPDMLAISFMGNKR